jgi:hypothetical protein
MVDCIGPSNPTYLVDRLLGRLQEVEATEKTTPVDDDAKYDTIGHHPKDAKSNSVTVSGLVVW